MANHASLFSKKVDERFTEESHAAAVTNQNYKFTGVKTINVYSLPVVGMNDYNRTGSGNRYGTATNLERNVQSLTITKDRSFTTILEKGDNMQNMNIEAAGKFLSRQTREVIIPEFDTYVFSVIANGATTFGNVATGSISASNAYKSFLDGMECLSDMRVPKKGRVAICTYGFANFLKQDSAFVKYSDRSQRMVQLGVTGEVDGCRLMEVPSSLLPAGAAFLITIPDACCAPKQLEEYKIHADPPGISGWQVDGRIIYDAFILNEKACGIYYHGAQAKLRNMFLITVPSASGKSTVTLTNPTTLNDSGNKWYYATASTKAGLPAVTYGTAITTSAWTELTASTLQITPTSGHKYIRVIECKPDSTDWKPISRGDAVLNIG